MTNRNRPLETILLVAILAASVTFGGCVEMMIAQTAMNAAVMVGGAAGAEAEGDSTREHRQDQDEYLDEYFDKTRWAYGNDTVRTSGVPASERVTASMDPIDIEPADETPSSESISAHEEERNTAKTMSGTPLVRHPEVDQTAVEGPILVPAPRTADPLADPLSSHTTRPQ